MSNPFFIQLTPYNLYFFGGEQGEKADYFLKGNPIPQQTALLGMVRYQLLAQNNLLVNNKMVKNAEEWIGKQSFQLYKEDQEQSFGVIKKLSPCYLVHKAEKYLPVFPFYFKDVQKFDDTYYLPHYDAKKQYSLCWKNIDNDEKYIKDFYKEVERVGVDKNYEGKIQEKSFFKQVWNKMENDFSFGFFLELEETVEFNNESSEVIFKSADVNLGKDNALFRMEIKQESFPTNETVENANALYLTSDAYVNQEFLANSNFAVCDTVPFRTLNTSYETKNHYGEHKGIYRIQLLKRGSVFISDKIKKMTEVLDSYKNFQKIGYNTYKEIKINITNHTKNNQS